MIWHGKNRVSCPRSTRSLFGFTSNKKEASLGCVLVERGESGSSGSCLSRLHFRLAECESGLVFVDEIAVLPGFGQYGVEALHSFRALARCGEGPSVG